MDLQEFKTYFKRVVYAKGLVTSQEAYLRSLHAWDKNGSHDEAILKALDNLDKRRNSLKELLKGVSYEEWTKLSNEVSKLTHEIGSLEMRLDIKKARLQIILNTF